MAGIYAFFIALLCMQSVAHAAGTGADCVINSTTATEQCDSGLYCKIQSSGTTTSYKCTQCPDTHPKSTMGQNNQQSDCYKTCGNKPDFENGTWAPDHTTANYDNDCQYTDTNNITCNNTSNKCSGYHLSNKACVSNKEACTNGSHTGFKTYDSNTSGWSSCLITTCSSGYHLESTANMCGQAYGTCVSNTKTCASELSCDNGTITGTIRWQNNTYNYSDCKCNRTVNLNYGAGTELCTWNGNTWSNCQITLKSCKAGYWQGETENPTDCTQVSAGYYSAENELTRDACPAGSTSAAGSTAQTNCYMTGGTTQICDSDNNCFLLPASAGDIYYHGSTQ